MGNLIIKKKAPQLTQPGYSAGTEFALALLPWKLIWKLQMKRKEKVGVAIAMSMGIL